MTISHRIVGDAPGKGGTQYRLFYSDPNESHTLQISLVELMKKDSIFDVFVANLDSTEQQKEYIKWRQNRFGELKRF